MAGHDPENYAHIIGEQPTDLSLPRHSPGYRLILNNILFPAAKTEERKTQRGVTARQRRMAVRRGCVPSQPTGP